MVFGPYQGILIDDATEAEKDGYCWELRYGAFIAQVFFENGLFQQGFRSHNGQHFIDGSNTQYSNWMRYINSSRRRLRIFLRIQLTSAHSMISQNNQFEMVMLFIFFFSFVTSHHSSKNYSPFSTVRVKI